MLAGGLGNIRAGLVEKGRAGAGAPVIVLGGPAMLIGLGGGAASSMQSGTSTEDLDFASVQRGNPEIQRRCQEVIDRCWALGEANPIIAIHDVGAGGLSNAVPEIVNDGGRGGRFELRTVPNADPGMSPMEVWCNEAQERYVLIVEPAAMDRFRQLCERERAPFAVIGETTVERHLLLGDARFANTPVDLPLDVLLGKPPKMLREVHTRHRRQSPFQTAGLDLAEAAERVLRVPTVASKGFLITIGDRSVGGMVARDQMVGPWQVPVADVGVTTASYHGYLGEALALGERSPVALLDGPASGRMAVAEALTNIVAAPIDALRKVRLSANWMAAAGHDGEDARLYRTVEAVAMELCPALGIAIPVGKDSLSMKAIWTQDGMRRTVTAPLSLIVSAFAPVSDVRRVLTPQLRVDGDDSSLLLIDLGHGRNRLGGSALAQAFGHLGNGAPDLDDPKRLQAFFAAIQRLNTQGRLIAYHDRSDGGLFACVCEMAFAGHCGVEIDLSALGADPVCALFAEELGAVVQVRDADRAAVWGTLEEFGLDGLSYVVGKPSCADRITFRAAGQTLVGADRSHWHRVWAETSFAMQRLRDNPVCAEEEFQALDERDDPGLSPLLRFDPEDDVAAPFIGRGARPRIAVLREQGINGQLEMAAAFDRAGFCAVDVHMSDIIAGRTDLADCVGLAACGGFSYGDVLGAGAGWAKSILFNVRARDVFAGFVGRSDTFALGVCNGCQMLANLRELIPGAAHWPQFVRNRSEQFEARLTLVEIPKNASLFMAGMDACRLPVIVAHAEGQAEFSAGSSPAQALETGLVCLRYVDHWGQPTERFPDNPNGSPMGITGLTTADGRFTIMMPHPERLFRTVQHSWHPEGWGEAGPWLRMFRNARAWVG
jgi:phosphoribosylformylglycinamidine synthase